MPQPDTKIDYSSPAYIEAYTKGAHLAKLREDKPNSRDNNAKAGYADAYYDSWSRRQIGILMASAFREETRGKTVANALAL